jgi:hypothetical protein
MVLIADKYYTVNLAGDGSTLELTEAQPAFGSLVIEPTEAAIELKLWSDAADQHLSRVTRQRQLPVGRYQALFAALLVKDSDRNGWTFSASRKLGPLGSFEIAPGETTRVRIGPPFVVTAEVTHSKTNTVAISPVIRGCGGEEYQADVKLNGRRLSAPAFKIVDEDGNVLVQDKFKYG